MTWSLKPHEDWTQVDIPDMMVLLVQTQSSSRVISVIGQFPLNTPWTTHGSCFSVSNPASRCRRLRPIVPTYSTLRHGSNHLSHGLSCRTACHGGGEEKSESCRPPNHVALSRSGQVAESMSLGREYLRGSSLFISLLSQTVKVRSSGLLPLERLATPQSPLDHLLPSYLRHAVGR